MIVGVRRWPGWLEALWWAVRALRAELWGFRFQYPVEAVVAPGGEDSLHYHVFSEQLFFDAMELDADGVPVQHGRTFGDAYNPAYVAWYGLMRLERAVRGEDPSGREAFLTQATWLAAHAVRRPDGGVVWHYPFDYVEGAGGLPAPWISAMSQGLAMSALIRAYLSPPKYHALHRAQFTALAHLSGEPMLDQYARAWDPDRLTLPERAEVFVVFVITKNWGRLIHHLRVRRVLARAKAGTVAG